VRPRGRGVSAWTQLSSARTLCVHSDAGCGRTDVSVLPPGNFVMDATVRPSHARLSGHRPSVCPSIRPSVR
jgi:hypothetical protein